MNEGIRILLVEDNPGDALLIREALKESSYRNSTLFEAGSLADALKFADENIALLLLDLGLPDSDGLETVRDIYKKFPDSALIVLTGLDDEKVAVETLKEGAQNYLTKDEIEKKLLEKAILFSLERHLIIQKLKRIEKEIEESKYTLEKAQEIAHIGSWAADLEKETAEWSDETQRIFGFKPGEFDGKASTFFAMVHPEDEPDINKEIENSALQKRLFDISHRIIRKNGESRWVHSQAEVFFNDHGKPQRLIGSIQDITQMKEAEAKIIKGRRLYSFISCINQMIVHVKDEQALFDEACRIAYEIGKFKIAWIGAYDPVSETVSLVAGKGILQEDMRSFQHIPCSKDSVMTAQHQVLISGNHFVGNNLIDDFELQTWKPFAEKYGLQSFMVHPVKREGTIVGTFNLYSSEQDFFDRGEINLLEEVAGDISFALDVFEKAKRQKEAEDRIVKNEKRFRALIEKSPDMKTLATRDGYFLYTSPSMTKVLGYTPDELLQTSVIDIIHAEDLPAFIEERNELLLSPGNSFTFQQRRRHKNGKWVWCEGTLTNLLDEPGINAMLTNFRDISEKKMAEREREFDHNNLHALINNTKDLMWSVDRDFKLITSNQPFNEIVKLMSGKTIERGSDVLTITFFPEQVNRFKMLYERAFAGESFTEIQNSVIPFESWSEISYYPIRKDDLVIGTACHSRDISERIRIEQQLGKSEAFNRGVLNSLSSHIAVVNGLGNIVAVNEAWKRFGTENEKTTLHRSAEGSNYYKVCIKEGGTVAAAVLSGMADVMSEKKPSFTLEYPCHLPDRERWFSVNVLKFEGDEPLIVVSHTDISERKVAELERNKMTDDLIQRNKDLEQFSYIVSHNLRAPVANIIGLSEAVQNEIVNPELKREVMESLTHSVKKLDDVIVDLNHILQTKRGMSEDKELVHFSAIANDIHASIENVIVKEKAVLIWDFSEVDEMMTLKSYLHSIFYNLVTNSLKYRQPGIPPVIEITSYKTADKIELLFKDNGMGIDLEKKGDKVFGLYKRFHSQSAEGKGMGLFLVKTQVEVLGGKISISSNVNIGTTFKIEFAI